MTIANDPTYEELSKFLTYCPETGILTWINSSHKYRIGTQAGCLRSDGYVSLKFKRKQNSASRIAWILAHGSIDSGMQIDHINRVPSDNRLCNLRLVTASQNCRNRHLNGKEPRHWTKLKNGKYQLNIYNKYAGMANSQEEAERMIRKIKGMP